jgi:hypothetical protein
MKVFKNIFFLLITNCVLFLLIFFMIEGIFRLVGIPYSKHGYIPDENSFARFDPELGWSYIPNISAVHEVGNGAIKSPVYFDENGFRVPRAGLKLSYIKPSVIFIGGSFTMGHGLSYDESFVGKFDSLKDIPFQIVNMGVQGYGSDQALLTLKKHLSKFNAKVVVYTFIEDHVRRNGNYDRRTLIPQAKFLGTKPLLNIDDENKLYLEKKPLLYDDYLHSYLYDFLKIRLGTLLGTFPPFPEDVTKAIILEMKRYSEERGARFVVLNWRWTEDGYSKIFDDLHVDVIDTMENTPAGWKKMVIRGGFHPDARAGDHIASLLHDYFASNGLLNQNTE